MATKNRQRLKKQKKQKAKRDRQPKKNAPLAYRGNKYKTSELVPVMLGTETSIYEAFVIANRQLTDHHVRAALEELIRKIRRGTFFPLDDSEQSNEVAEGMEGLVLWNIRNGWRHSFETKPNPGRDKLIGVLRTILGSIEVRGSISPKSRGYLEFLGGFLGKVGVEVQVISPDTGMILFDE